MSRTQQALAALACMLAIAVTAGVCQLLLPVSSPLLLASMGASAVILFVLPTSPVAQPWAFVGGHWVSALLAYALTEISDKDLFLLPAVMLLSVWAMQLLRCLHPPGAATALAIVLLPSSEPDHLLALTVIALNTATMLTMALLLHRLLPGHHYPRPVVPVAGMSRLSEQRLRQAIDHRDHMVDISQDELREIVAQLQWSSIHEVSTARCADWLRPETEALSYDQSVESAWRLMRRLQRQLMPVVDDKQRLIGILALEQFLHYLDQSQAPTLRERWRRFIKPSTSLHTDKPEVVGHLMIRQPLSCQADSLVATLWPLMIAGHNQLPVVNQQSQLLGMVYWQDVLQYVLASVPRATEPRH